MEGIREWVGYAVGFLLLGWLLRGLQQLWWRPREMEKKIRATGIDGNSYRFIFGDLREGLRLYREAMSKPMSLSHDIALRVQPFNTRLAKIYGKVFLTWNGPTPRIVISDPALIKEVLQNKGGAIGIPNPSPIEAHVITGLLAIDGEKWSTHRKIINPAFHFEKLKGMQSVFSLCCTKLVERWESFMGDRDYCEIDAFPEIQNFTRDVIARAAFGSSFEEGRQIFELQEEQANLVIQSFLYFQIPGYRFLPTKNNLRLKEIDANIKSQLREIVARREKAIQMGHEAYNDLLSLLLQFNQAQMSREEIIAECKLIYFAGQETTSNLLTWALITLAMNPNWQSRARAEVLQVFGREKPNFEKLSHLKIVSAIIQEVLRLYPPATFVTRQVKASTKVGEYTFPEGVQLMLEILLVHHDSEYWGEDATEFNPERFGDGTAKAFFSFGGGPRVCVGQSFAMAEAKMGLASILQRFSFELSPAYTHAPFTVITLQPQHGAQLIFRRL